MPHSLPAAKTNPQWTDFRDRIRRCFRRSNMVEATQMNSHDSGEGYETSTLPCRTVARHVQSGKYVCGSNTSVGSVDVSVNLPLTRTGTGSPTDGREAQCEPSWRTRDTRAMHSSAAGASMRRCSIPTMSPRGTWCGFGARVLIALFARGGRRTRRSFRSRSSRRRSCVGGRGQPAACAAGRSSSGPGSPASGRISCVVSFAVTSAIARCRPRVSVRTSTTDVSRKRLRPGR